MSSDEEDFQPAPKAKTPKKAAAKSVESTYQKLEQLEHILKRPDTYVGSVLRHTEKMWVYDPAEKKLVLREIKYVPGLYKIFDEILVNAADNKQRDASMTEIKIVIKPESNMISVWNNGKGIPIVMHKKENMYVPTLIFGHLLTSSNYNDDEKKVTGGRNGYGAKLCNVFSTKFVLHTASKDDKLTFRQEWSSNMSHAAKEVIEKNPRNQDYTMVEFYPDLAKFQMENLDDDTVALMCRRAFDLAGTVRGVKVRLNDDLIPVTNFEDYVKMYTKDGVDDLGQPLIVVAEKIAKGAQDVRWEVAVTVSPDEEFRQVSFVNGIATTKGGRHVDYITDQIVKVLSEALKKKNKTGSDIKPAQIKKYLWVFVNCLIENPTFDSQTKETMTLQTKQFGSKFTISDDFTKRLLKMGVVENILAFASAKAKTKLDKVGGVKTSKLKGIPKLEDANDAGTRHSADCTLILTEGDSAKALVVSGFSVVGRDKYGVFPLRGKLLNVRDASPKQLIENAEIQNIVKILGLKFKCKYDNDQDLKSLRYGRLMIMTDQDQDGSHIKGLLINFIHHSWPHLLKRRFLEQFITPIVKATKGDVELSFYSLPEFEEWKLATADWHKYRVKYFKGLGTSTSKEAKEYFSNMTRHQIDFRWGGPEDDNCIEMAFGKGKADARKEWLTEGMENRKQRRLNGEKEIFLYEKTTKHVSYSDFVNKELILFSNADNERSIPSLVDGLKPGQRKVLFTCFKRNDKREIKVAQLAGSVAEHSAYHHGEVSLQSTIVGLAQDYVGSNNINLLMPCGQFGTRLQGGKDSASPRYIFTMLSPLARAIFSQLDAPLLNYLHEENQKIEPEWYMPIVPMVLVNGADGIGTGWMTKIPNYNPRDIVDNLRRMMRNEPVKHMTPWFKGHRGEMKELDGGERIVTSGECAVLDEDNTIEITELPIRVWTQNYKEATIEPMVTGTETKTGKAKPPQIQDYREYHTDTTVRFVVKMDRTKFLEFQQEGFHKVFKLQTTISMSSMVLFDSNGVIRKYDSVASIMREFFDLRLSFYQKRKDYWVAALGAEAKKLQNQARFIEEKIEGVIKIEDVKRGPIIQMLVARKYDSDPLKAWKKTLGAAAEEEPPTNEEDVSDTADKKVADTGPDFDYLMGMTFWKVSNEQKVKLLEERDKKEAELNALKKKSLVDLWNADLEVFLEKLDEAVITDREAQGIQTGGPSKPMKGVKAAGGGRSKKGVAIPNKADTMPAPNSIRVEPIIDPGLINKLEKAKDLKERKAAVLATGEPMQRGGRKKEVGENGEVIEKPKKKTIKKESNGDAPSSAEKDDGKSKMKQTTLDGNLKKKVKKEDSDEESLFDSDQLTDADDDVIIDDDDEEDEYSFDKEVKKIPANKNRAAATVVSALVDDDEIQEIIEVKPLVTKSKSTVTEPAKPSLSKQNETKKKTTASTKANGTPSKTVRLVSSSDDDEEDFKSKKKPAAPKVAKKKDEAVAKKAPPKRKVMISESEDDDTPGTSGWINKSPVKKSKSEASRKATVLDSDEEISAPRVRPPGRAAASRKVFADSSLENLESDEDYLETIE